MRKFLIAATIITLLFLSACGAAPAVSSDTAATTAPAADAVTNATASLNTDFDDAASIEQQLLVGILKLEGSENALTTDQASQMLPLWQSLNMGGGRGMGNGGQPGNADAQSTPQTPAENAPAAVDTDTVLSQIQGLLTSAQIEAISAMQISNAAVASYISDNALSMQPGNGGPQGGNQQQGTSPADDASQGQPQGNPPDGSGNGNGQGGPQGGPGAQADGTLAAPNDGQMPDMSTNVLLNAVIQLLQQKTGAQAPASN